VSNEITVFRVHSNRQCDNYYNRKSYRRGSTTWHVWILSGYRPT